MTSRTRSKLQTEKKCYYTESYNNLTEHHIFNGAYRKKSDIDGFVIWVTFEEHDKLHSTAEGVKKRLELKRIAQKIYERDHTREEFIKRYGKSYL